MVWSFSELLFVIIVLGKVIQAVESFQAGVTKLERFLPKKEIIEF